MALSYKNDEQEDERLNPATRAGNLGNLEEETGKNAAVNAGIDQVEAFANDPANASKNIDNAKEQEESGDSQQGFYNPTGEKKSAKGRFSGLKRKSPIAVIFALLGGGGFLMTTLLSPALLLMHVKNVFLNDLSDATPAQIMRSDRMMRNWVKDKVGVRAGFCGSKVTVRCKFATMSKRMEKKFTKAGFTVEGDKRLGRRVISSMKYTTQDGVVHTITNPKELAAFSKSPEGRSAVFKAFNPKTAAFLDSKFSKMLLEKFHLTKRSTEEGKDKKAIQESFDKATGADEAGDPKEGGRFKEAVKGSKDIAGKLSGVGAKLAALSLICPVYETAHAVSYSIKAAKVLAFTAFAYEFLKETDKIIAGDGDPEVVSTLGDQMTSLTTDKTVSDNNGGGSIDNPGYMKSPTDSEGYRLSAYGDTGSPNANTAKFSLGLPQTGVMGIIGLILAAPSMISGGKAALSIFCKFFGNAAVGAGGTIAACTIAAATVVGGIACAAVNAAAAYILGRVLGFGIGKLVPYLVKEYGPMALGAATKGVDVGNAMAVGSGLVLGGMAQSDGMMPSKKGDLKTYFAYTDETRKNAVAADVYDAKKTPFDIYNQYSFAGSIIQPLNATLMSESTIGGKFAGLLGTITSSFMSFGKASAAYNMPAQPYEAKRYSICDDQEMKDANIDPDMLCTPRYSMSPAELDMDPDANVVYMVNNGHIDEETGEPKSEDYKNFIEYCGIDRKDPIGSVEGAFDDDKWHTGKACSDKSTMMSNFRVYTMDGGIDDSFENDPGSSSGGSSSTGTSDDGTITPGGDVAGDDYSKDCAKYANCTRECVDFVLYRLVKHGVLPGKQALGNGKDVVATLAGKTQWSKPGIKFATGTTPQVNSVFSTSHTTTPQWGHTGMVSKVNADGSIVVEEYNFNVKHGYGTRTITKAEYQAKGYTFAYVGSKYK